MYQVLFTLSLGVVVALAGFPLMCVVRDMWEAICEARLMRQTRRATLFLPYVSWSDTVAQVPVSTDV